MNILDVVTPVILTRDEAPNIGRTLAHLTWAKRVVVIDSFSTDDTLRICQQSPNVEVFQRTFDTLAKQCNFGLAQVSSDWVLSLDADYTVTDLFVEEMRRRLRERSAWCGFFTPFQYCVFGKPLRGSLLPPRCTLFQRAYGSYIDDGHAHRLQLSGPSAQFTAPLLHDDWKPLSRWMSNQISYSALEAKKLSNTKFVDLGYTDKIRSLIFPAPILAPLWALFVKGVIWDGWRGWYYAMQRMVAELLLSLRIVEEKFRAAD